MDHHLNSIHLESPRREEFRKARARLLDACGDQTRYVINNPEAVSSSPTDSKTIIQNLENRLPKGVSYALMDKDAVYPLKVGLNTIGRLPDNDVVLQDAFVSRRHCAILVHAGNGCELHDVASKNGTFLNNSRIPGPVPLKSGDEIRLCDRKLVFISKTAAAHPPSHAMTMPK
jgi:pSer/pThr/pTyr-binding forkhead associated (FHA) protein